MTGGTLSAEDRLGACGDDFYDLLIRAHDGLDFTASAALNVRLLLILANEIGDFETLKAAVQRASEG
ncbi:MAG: DUF2783 domain-containing protein [Alphaproteobacteria bacterium]|nr:MAG: DUF2783 domain-containing protein [Alphaproteobacteria bacterium]